jgi:hypothetical protein
MTTESLDVIDVSSEIIENLEPEVQRETEETWYASQEVQNLARISKPHLQQAISKLQSIYGLDIAALRRGVGRATEYSQLALDACKLLNTGKLSELRKLVETAPTAPTATTSTAIVFLDQHQQIAQTASTVADSNLTQIASFKSGLLNNYRELGRALGKQAAAEVRLGFTEEVKAALSDLQES